MEDQNEREGLEKRPGILFIGSPNVGKRTLLSRLLSVDFEDASDSSSEVLVQGWTIDTKYYSADVSLWMAHLHDGFSVGSLPNFNQFAALVMVFDMNELSSLSALKKWVSHTDIRKFDILLCIGNKVDLMPGHPAHEEYRRHLRRAENSFSSPDVDFSDYGISETEGSSLLGDDEPSNGVKTSCFEWCMEHNIEYVEACASNADFDKCLSLDGDSQGVERLLGALSAHMWPGMVLKSGHKILAPILPEGQESSEEESDYEGEYEVLSGGSVEHWDVTDDDWLSAKSAVPSNPPDQPSTSVATTEVRTNGTADVEHPSTSSSSVQKENGPEMTSEAGEADHKDDFDMGALLELDDLEQIMSEIANIRSNSRLMPDFQRREMAAKLTLRMAAMFGDSSGDEGGE